MVDEMKDRPQIVTQTTVMNRVRRFAWIPIVVVDVGFLLWGAMGALVPDHLLGPHAQPILIAGYEGFTKGSWSALVQTSPQTAHYISMLFRLYCAFNVAFSLPAIALAITAFRRGSRWAWWALLLGNTIALGGAMTYDRLVHAIGPFEMTEYVGLALIWAALAVTAPYGAGRAGRSVAAELPART
jgi:hypothetical protein